MTRRRLAIVLSTLLAATLPLFSATLQAADAATSLLKLHQLRLATQKSLGDFYMFNGMEGDQRYARMINDSLSEVNSHLTALTDMPGEGAKALRAQLDQQWKGYEMDLNNLVNALKSQGYTDLQPVADLAARNQHLMTLSQELYSKIQQEGNYSVPALTQRSREQSLLMQGIAVDYASRSASVGATFMGGGDTRSIEDMVSEFSNNMKTLKKDPKNTPQLAQSWQGVATKWRYIEKSLINYNENSVPFLVNKYSNTIIQGIEQISSEYATANL
jgi:non-ribosomal peptide synthetase component F